LDVAVYYYVPPGLYKYTSRRLGRGLEGGQRVSTEYEVVGFEHLEDKYKHLIAGRGRLDEGQASSRASRLAGLLSEFNARMVAPSEGLPPLVIVEDKDVVIVVAVYSDGYVVCYSDVVRVVEWVLGYKEEKGKKALLVVYSRKGRLGPVSYLFLGGVIREHDVGVLYVNGGLGEVVEVVETVLREGRYEADEYEPVDLSTLDD